VGCDIHYGIEVCVNDEWKLYWANTCTQYYLSSINEIPYGGDPLDYEILDWGEAKATMSFDYETLRRSNFYFNRDYAFFALLGNVRNDGTIPFLSRDRGLPDDISDPMYNWVKSWDSDGHSHSYLTLDEFYNLPPICLNDFLGLFGNYYARLLPAMRSLAKDPEDVRMLFFFDN
jgi:hypothetical protein